MSRMQSFWRVALAGIAAWGVAVVSHAQQAQPADDLNELNNAINPCRVDRNLPRKTLQECTAIALQQQPALQAIRASLQQAEIGLESLRKVGRVGTLLVPDLKVRREQAERGVAVLYAELGQAEVDTRYRVGRLYFSAVCAEILYCLAKEGAEVLADNAKNIEATLNDVPPRDFPFTTYSVNRLKTLAATLAAKREEARLGYYLALAALREACGVGPDCLFAPADTNLPYVRVTLTREEIVTQALARRGELFMAMLGAEVVHLEAQAQDSVRFRPSFRTFASGSDIHSRALPVEQRGKDYAPGAIGLEMPVSLAGSRATRVGRALALGERADAVVAKTRNLITLDAEGCFLSVAGGQQQTRRIAQGPRSSSGYPQDRRLQGRHRGDYLYRPRGPGRGHAHASAARPHPRPYQHRAGDRRWASPPASLPRCPRCPPTASPSGPTVPTVTTAAKVSAVPVVLAWPNAPHSGRALAQAQANRPCRRPTLPTRTPDCLSHRRCSCHRSPRPAPVHPVDRLLGLSV
jgi:outer membrane protein TolC